MTRHTLPAIGRKPVELRAGHFARQLRERRARRSAVELLVARHARACPTVSERSAWDFMPPGWTRRVDDSWCAPPEFRPITQLDFARLRVVTPEMRRVAEREPHLTPEQVRDEVAAGRMVIPANRSTSRRTSIRCASGAPAAPRSTPTWARRRSPAPSDEEIDKLRWAERWGADTVMDLSTGGDLDATREAIVKHASVPVGTVPIYSMIIGRRIEDLDAGRCSRRSSTRRARASTTSRFTPACCASTCPSCRSG